MWLLNARTEKLAYFNDERAKNYAILSHTWSEEEVTFQDIQNGCARKKKGHEKVRYTCEQARKDGIPWVWIDTLCINKESSAELSEAINSMYRWYRATLKCYVYLEDAHSAVDAYERDIFTNPSHDPRTMNMDDCSIYAKSVCNALCLEECRWFSRGWTLQELIAPLTIHFFGPNWYFLGTKRSLLGTLASITNIDQEVLEYGTGLSTLSIATKMSWAANRQTSRLEDRAYSLLGIFGINMPLLYGEGPKAFLRLQEAIIHQSTDLSILAWNNNFCRHQQHLLAVSPDDFEGCRNIVHYDNGADTSYQLTNKGLEARIPLVHDRSSMKSSIFGVLNCRVAGNPIGPLVLRLAKITSTSLVKAGGLSSEHNVFVVSPWDGLFSRTHVLPLEDLKFANKTLLTILSNPPERPFTPVVKNPCSVWIHLASESYTGTETFQQINLEATSMECSDPREEGQASSFKYSRISVFAENTDLFEPVENYPHDASALWSIKKPHPSKGSLKVLMLGVAIRAYESHVRTGLFYWQVDYKEYQDRPDGIDPLDFHKVLEDIPSSKGFFATIADWAQVVVKAENTVRMGDKVTAITVSLYDPTEHVPTTERLSMGCGLDCYNLHETLSKFTIITSSDYRRSMPIEVIHA